MVAPDILSSFAAILLDMNGTFMFREDRFGPDQDFAATYRALGGRRLAAELVQGIVGRCCETLGTIYDDPARCDSFPQVRDTLRVLPEARGVPESELDLLEAALAQHELGRVSDPYAAALQRLARTHRLGLVANILSRKDLWLRELTRAGVLDLFAVTVFSSDGSSIKPSRRLFDQALTALAVPRSAVIFVGDSLRCDIGGAAGAGLATVWIDRQGLGRQADGPQPDYVVRDLLELLGAQVATRAMSDSFTVRTATVADAPILARHRAEMFRDMGVLPEHLLDVLVDASRRYFEEAIPSGEYVGWLAARAAPASEIIAGAGLQLRRVLPHPDPGGRAIALGPQGVVLNVYTEPAWRRRGLAALLMRHVLDWAGAHGITSLVLHASRDARGLYEKLGFVPTNEMRFAGQRQS